MNLEDLVGKHVLTGVDLSTESIRQYGDYFEDCNVINFVLDGVTYTAVEDPSDGYRSSMRDIQASDYKVSNTFPGVEVIASLRTAGKYSGTDEVLELRDTANGKLILEVGTENVDDYYPGFVCNFSPENMSINDGK